MQRILIPAAGCLFAFLTISSCRHDGRTLRPADPSQNASVFTPSTTTTIVDDSAQPVITDVTDTAIETAGTPFVLTTPWLDDGLIDPKYTCSGAGLSPAISWTGAPSNAVSMALVVTDTDSDGFVNWVIADLEPASTGLAESQVPIGAIEGTNGASTAAKPSVGWKQPCPQKGAMHHYRFTLYALDQQVDLPSGSPASDIIAIIDSTSIQAAQITGVYTTP